jgi:ATP-dependent RNA helicase HelY
VRADRAELTARFDFSLDRFQRVALDVVDEGRHLVVAAPTGSGKTVVAEYGIAAALADGRRAFYTAPIKALSNQKYRDLSATHGEDRVGLLTGDNAINGDAPIVVMTTEVLRNMIYARSRGLHDLGFVVLDEVHFLQDAYRGPVWEEVIIHLPRHVQLACLSATVSNVRELADWISTVRGRTEAVVEERRPVRLVNRYLVADRTADRLRLLPMFVGGRVNRDAVRLDDMAARHGPTRRSGPGGGRRARNGPWRGSERRRLAPPGRVETAELLRAEGLLPAIHFIFSRAQCDEAARSCLDAGVVLTTGAERADIRRIADERLGDLDADDLEILGYARFIALLEAGVAAHHAGMVPAMKEVVEQCFAAGLVKLVFATETLAVGINMPARSVVIEKLTKFTGDHHERLTAGEYTQLTGRAGRRGIDEVGDAVVLWSPWIRFDEVAQLAGSTSFHLRSAFRPTYNMAANLIRTYSSEEAHHLLNLSFAQYQADRDVVRLEARIERRRAVLDELRDEAASPFGDIEAYRRVRATQQDELRARRARQSGEMRGALARLRPGAIVHLATSGHRGPAVVIASAHRKVGVRLTLVDRAGGRFYATADDFDAPPRPRGQVELPQPFSPNRRDWLADVGRRLRRTRARPAVDDGRAGGPTDGSGADGGEVEDPDLMPVARDPDLAARLRAAAQVERVERELADLERRVGDRTRSLAQDFDRVLQLLDRYGHVDLARWRLTPAGTVLAQVFHECDLLVTEAVRDGLLDDLGPADTAALVSCVVYEHRSAEPAAPPWFSSDDVRRRWRRLEALSEDLAANERAAGLAEHRRPDPTFAAVAHAWVAGEGFAEVVADEELSGGDFVRTTKQLVDLLRQLALVAPSASLRASAAAAAEAAYRGVVADTSVGAPA